jgi:hypothetical protein
VTGICCIIANDYYTEVVLKYFCSNNEFGLTNAD